MCAILAAAGRGERMGRPKQLLELDGKPVAGWSLEKLARAGGVDDIIIACEADQLAAFRQVANRYGAGKVRAVVEGGARRQDSVRAALRHAGATCEVVVVHDGARPLFGDTVLQQVIQAAHKAGAAIAAVPVKDTIKESNGSGVVLRTIPRERLWAAQTPQA
ncbi:MAG: 2-C-methyl-D-erythritol 4-phosphate cytidylyltransferase, partial [Candidatus Eremiobacteraeota bacterium]|nr:2-C-methyl-D-erythritol 4-phosphate cytidylyltransferase [Candidatus Eremiobacteraeota bacterium]